MKKILLVAAIATISLSMNAQDVSRANVIKINPLGLLFGSASATFEHAVNKTGSFWLAPQFGGFKLGGLKYSSFGGGVGYRFYLSHTNSAPAGFWVGPGVTFTSGTVKYGEDTNGDGIEDKDKFTAFGGNLMLGNQWCFKSGFVIDLGGGVQYTKFNYKQDNNSESIALKGSGIFPALTFAIGYNF